MIVINPGTEPVAGATEENALQAALQFVNDLAIQGLALERDVSNDRGGRFGFTIKHPSGRYVSLNMPGCDASVTRASQPWHSPRLYVDGSSWLWDIGINIARSHLNGEG